jgi:ribulose 1,5-bisphosphate synthetase/thiazole synthase
MDVGVSMTAASCGLAVALSMKNVSNKKATSVIAVMSTEGAPRLGLCFGIMVLVDSARAALVLTVTVPAFYLARLYVDQLTMANSA